MLKLKLKMKLGGLPQAIAVVFRADFADIIDYYADEIYNADSTVGDQGVEVIKAKDVL